MVTTVFVEYVRRACQAHGVELREYSDGWVLELTKNEQTHRVIATDFDLNSQAAAAIATDKVAASQLLAASHVPHVRHELFLARDGRGPRLHVLRAMLEHSPVILKPLTGRNGEGVVYVTEESEARSAVEGSTGEWAISPYVRAEHEIRVVVLDGEVRLAHRKQVIHTGGLARFNLSRGAAASSLPLDELSEDVRRRAVDAARVLGLRLVAVDILKTKKGFLLLELNASFSLSRYAKTNAATADEVAAFYDNLIATIFQ